MEWSPQESKAGRMNRRRKYVSGIEVTALSYSFLACSIAGASGSLYLSDAGQPSFHRRAVLPSGSGRIWSIHVVGDPYLVIPFPLGFVKNQFWPKCR